MKTTTTDRLLKILSDLDGVEYSYHRDVNGWVLSHIGPNGYAVHTPVNDLETYCQRRGIDTQCHPSGCSCGSPERPEWIAAQQGECE